jgi:flagellar L-ring protein precursor FlgH
MKSRIAPVVGAMAILMLAASAQRPGSIYNPDMGPGGRIAAKTAFRKGDLVTVIISETQNVKNAETSDLSRATNLNYALNVFDIKPNAFSTLPEIDATSDEGFSGSANYQKSGVFTARLAAIVVDALPNGNLVVTGRREIHIDNEIKLIEFSGIVRRFDIGVDNTIQSELVANADIRYRGQGPLTDTTNRYGIGGAIHRFFAWLWPF